MLWHEGCIFHALFDVDDISDSIRVAAVHELLPSHVDILGGDDLAIWVDVVLVAEVNDFLGLGDTSDKGASNALSIEHKRHLTEGVRVWNTSKANMDTLLLQKWEVSHKLMWCGHRVQDDITASSGGLD